VEAVALTLTIEQEVLRWPGVTATPGRFGATAFRYGEREIGHLHRRNRIADLPGTRVGNPLIGSGSSYILHQLKGHLGLRVDPRDHVVRVRV
jgi:hypothetical protein